MSSRLLLLNTSAAGLARRATLLASTRASAASTRTFTQSSILCLKETHGDDPDPNHYERHKQDSVQKAKSGKGHWKPELASNSEESIKADRESPKESDQAAMRRLQDRTKGTAEQLSKQGTSMHDGL